MTKDDLIAAASRIKPVPQQVAAEYVKKGEVLVGQIDRLLLQRPDLEELVGKGNVAMMLDNHSHHGRFIESVLQDFRPDVLVETVLWAYRTYRCHGFRLAYWPAQLNAWVEALKRELSPNAFRAVYPLCYWFIVNQPAFVSLTEDRSGAADVAACAVSAEPG
jgi:hypothetical protein